MACTSSAHRGSANPRRSRGAHLRESRNRPEAAIGASIQPSTREDATAGAITGTPAATTDWPTISGTRAVAAAPASTEAAVKDAQLDGVDAAPHGDRSPSRSRRIDDDADRQSGGDDRPPQRIRHDQSSGGPASGTSHAARNPPSTGPAIVPSEATRPRAAPTIATTGRRRRRRRSRARAPPFRTSVGRPAMNPPRGRRSPVDPRMTHGLRFVSVAP